MKHDVDKRLVYNELRSLFLDYFRHRLHQVGRFSLLTFVNEQMVSVYSKIRIDINIFRTTSSSEDYLAKQHRSLHLFSGASKVS